MSEEYREHIKEKKAKTKMASVGSGVKNPLQKSHLEREL